MNSSRTPGVLQAYIFKNDEFLGTEVFVEREVVVGRDPEVSDLVLDSSEVSREHARIDVNGARIQITDLSTNGLLLNGAPVQESPITARDSITVGEYTLKLKLQRRRRTGSMPTADATVVAPVVAAPDSVTSAPSEAPKKKAKSSTPRKKRRTVTSRAKTSDAAISDVIPTAGATKTSPAASNAAPTLKVVESPPLSPKESEAPSVSFSAAPAASVSKVGAAVTRLRWGAAREALRGLASRHWPSPRLPVGGVQSAGPAAAAVAVPEILPPGDLHPPEDDPEEIAELEYVPPFSLVDTLVQEASEVTTPEASEDVQLEVLTFLGDALVDAQLLTPGRSFWAGPNVGPVRRLRARDVAQRVRLFKMRKGSCSVQLNEEQQGLLVRGGQREALDKDALPRRRSLYTTEIKPGDVLEVESGARRYHARFVVPPTVEQEQVHWKKRLKPTKLTRNAALGSAGTHLFVMLLVWILAPALDTTPSLNDDFVEISLEQEVKLEEPPPKPEPPAPPAKPQPAPKKPPPKRARAKPTKRPKRGGTAKAPAGVLGLLSKKGSTAAPGQASVLAKVSNLSAARVPGGASGYRVSGLQGKLPTSDLSVGGGGGGLNTKGGAALLRGGGGGAGRLSGSGTRRVGGLVQKAPRAMRRQGQGSLDRDEIQKVINRNVSQIQRCYERELLKKPGLSGKVQVEWVIGTSGAVRSSRLSFSNLGSTDAVNCILGKVRGWRFPRPKGGEVIVNYPFIFKSIGF